MKKRELLLMIVFASVLLLFPTNTAFADYHDGDPCPECGYQPLRVSPLSKYSDNTSSEEMHIVVCNAPEDHENREEPPCGFWTYEPHYGGMATCTEKACCEGCRLLYGDPLGHDWVLNTEMGDNGWEWDADGENAAVHLICQRDGCVETCTVSILSSCTEQNYDESTGKVSYSATASVEKDGKAFTSTKNVIKDPTQCSLAYYAAGTYYMDLSQVPEFFDCHFQKDYWTGPAAADVVVKIDGEYYKVEMVDTLVCKPAECIQKIPAKPASCILNGTADYWQCSQCGKLFSDEAACHEINEPPAVMALGHDWGEWIVMKEPGNGMAGEQQRTCQREQCGEIETESIPTMTGYSLTENGNSAAAAGGSQTPPCNYSNNSKFLDDCNDETKKAADLESLNSGYQVKAPQTSDNAFSRWLIVLLTGEISLCIIFTAIRKYRIDKRG